MISPDFSQAFEAKQSRGRRGIGEKFGLARLRREPARTKDDGKIKRDDGRRKSEKRDLNRNGRKGAKTRRREMMGDLRSFRRGGLSGFVGA